MPKREEEWSTRDICFMLPYCAFLYILGILLLYFKVLFGFGLVFVATVFFIPAVIEIKKKLREYFKERRIENLRRTRETIIVGGVPEKHHKKKKQRETIEYPAIDDSVSKGKLMRELGLFYEKKPKKVSFSKKEIIESTNLTTPNRTYSQLNELFDALNYRKRIRIAHNANIGSGHHGGSIRKMVEAEAKRRGVNISLKIKGKDIIIKSDYKGEPEKEL